MPNKFAGISFFVAFGKKDSATFESFGGTMMEVRNLNSEPRINTERNLIKVQGSGITCSKFTSFWSHGSFSASHFPCSGSGVRAGDARHTSLAGNAALPGILLSRCGRQLILAVENSEVAEIGTRAFIGW